MLMCVFEKLKIVLFKLPHNGERPRDAISYV